MIRQETFRPGGARNCEDAIGQANINDPITIEPNDGPARGYVLLNQEKFPLGYVGARHWVTRELDEGRRILHASVNSKSLNDPPTLTVRVVIGDDADEYQSPSQPSPTPYLVGLSGETFYQSAIARLHSGERVELFHEPDNPHDAEAIIATGSDGASIGYLPRGSWVHRALLVEQKGYSAAIDSVNPSSSGDLGVVLRLTLDGAALGKRFFRRP